MKKIILSISVIVVVILCKSTVFNYDFLDYINILRMQKSTQKNEISTSKVVTTVNNETKDYKYFIADRNRKPINKDKFIKIKSIYSNNFIVSKDNNSTGVIDSDGKYIIEPVYKDITECGDSLFCAIKDKTTDIINKQGKIIKKDIYFKSLYTKDEKEKRKNYIFVSNTPFTTNTNEKVKISLYNGKFQKLLTFDSYNNTNFDINIYIDKYIMLKENKRIKLIDFTGKVIIPAEYTRIGRNFDINNKKYFIVEKEGEYGLIDINNNVIVPIQYSSIYIPKNAEQIWSRKYYLSNNLEVYDCFDFDGNKIKNPDMTTAPYGKSTNLNEKETIGANAGREHYIVQNNNKYGIKDLNKNIIVPIKYDECKYYEFGGYFVCGNYTGICSSTGLYLTGGKACASHFDIYNKKGKLMYFNIDKQTIGRYINKLVLKYGNDIAYKPEMPMFEDLIKGISLYGQNGTKKKTVKTLRFKDDNSYVIKDSKNIIIRE